MKIIRLWIIALVLGFIICGTSIADLADRTFNLFPVDEAWDVGIKPAIAVDKNGFVHISYYDRTNSFIEYATNRSSDWGPPCNRQCHNG